MMNTSRDDATSYGLLKTLDANPNLSQRELSHRLGVSLGKINFCLKALVGKGCLKVNNFKKSDHKLAYAYILTPRGMEEKARMTAAFLQCKVMEYDRLREEIEELRNEVEQQDSNAAI